VLCSRQALLGSDVGCTVQENRAVLCQGQCSAKACACLLSTTLLCQQATVKGTDT